jgi:hypothetical protein
VVTLLEIADLASDTAEQIWSRPPHVAFTTYWYHQSADLPDILSRLKDLRVPARTSSFAFKGVTVPMR